MSKTRVSTGLETLKALELKLAECLGEASSLQVPMAATLIGAALEEVGTRIEQEFGVTDADSEATARYDH